RCQNLPMNCVGAGGGLPSNCANEPSYRCELLQHQLDFALVRKSATKQGIALYTAPGYYSVGMNTGAGTCPAAGTPVPVDWGKLAPLVTALAALRPASGDKQVDGVLFSALDCEDAEVDRLAAAVRK